MGRRERENIVVGIEARENMAKKGEREIEDTQNDKIVARPCFPYSEIIYTDKTASLYWDSPFFRHKFII